MGKIKIRQLNLDVGSNSDLDLFNIAFPEFYSRKNARNKNFGRLEPSFKKHDADNHVAAYLATELTNPRRYAGSYDLGRNCYYALMGGKDVNGDGGTLIEEVREYWNPKDIFHTGEIVLFDTDSSDDYSFMRKYGINRKYNSRTLVCLFRPLHTKHITAAAKSHAGGLPVAVVVSYDTTFREIDLDGIFDLREPHYRKRMFEMAISQPELRKRMALNEINADDFFIYCLPTIIGERRGGTIFHTFIGYELRRDGFKGVIYPSARRDAQVEIINGRLNRWDGWCYLDYSGSPPPHAEFPTSYFDQFWKQDGFPYSVRIHQSSDQTYKHSFSISGLEKYRWEMIGRIINQGETIAKDLFENNHGSRFISRFESQNIYKKNNQQATSQQ